MDTTVNPVKATEHSKGRANLTLIGTLLSSMVQKEIAAGRWYVDDAGCAHPVDGSRPDVVEYVCDMPVLLTQTEEYRATP